MASKLLLHFSLGQTTQVVYLAVAGAHDKYEQAFDPPPPNPRKRKRSRGPERESLGHGLSAPGGPAMAAAGPHHPSLGQRKGGASRGGRRLAGACAQEWEAWAGASPFLDIFGQGGLEPSTPGLKSTLR